MHLGIDASRAVTTQRTGTEGYAYFLVKALISQAERRGHQLRLYFNQAPPAGLSVPQAAHVEWMHIPFPRLWTHWRLAWELVQRPPDVFFTPAHVIPLHLPPPQRRHHSRPWLPSLSPDTHPQSAALFEMEHAA